MSDCILWTGATIKSKKALYGWKGKTTAHRTVYMETFGEISSDLDVDHTCFNTLCVNPEHLRAVPKGKNRAETQRFLANECRKGHPLTPENTYKFKGENRRCKICKLEANRRSLERRKLCR